MTQVRDMRQLLSIARKFEASDLHVIAGLPPALRVHGEIVTIQSDVLSRERVTELTMSMLNERQKAKLETDLELCTSVQEPGIGRFRVTVYYHAGVPELAIRLCALTIPEASGLGLPPMIADLARKPNGLVLVCGRNGVGKTTTLNFMVDLINRERRAKILTIEDPVEYQHHPVKSVIVQQEVYSDTVSFPRALVHGLRQNPDVIVIGEMRDLESISTAITASETGHLVLATLHTPSVLQAVERITGVFSPTQQKMVTMQFASCLQGIVCQDLIPTADRSHRVLACELLLGTDAVKNMIREGKSHLLLNVISTGRKAGMMSMDQTLLDLYQKGVITYDAAANRMRDPTALNGNNRQAATE